VKDSNGQTSCRWQNHSTVIRRSSWLSPAVLNDKAARESVVEPQNSNRVLEAYPGVRYRGALCMEIR